MSENNRITETYEHIGVIGAGAWGTALACAAAQAGRSVTLWAREPEVVRQIQASGENGVFLPGVKLPRSIAATGDIAAAAKADALLIVVPAQHLRESLKSIEPLAARGTPLVLCAKGIERASGMLLTEILRAEIPGCEPAILSGPSFSRKM